MSLLTHLNWVSTKVNIETLDRCFKGYNKILGRIDNPWFRGPVDTRPIISDYSYRLNCKFKIMDKADLTRLRKNKVSNAQKFGGLYLSPDLIPDFERRLRGGDLDVEGFDYLLVGRYSKIRDYTLRPENLNGLNSSFKEVWAEQLTQEFENVRAIPVGIEDLSYPAGMRFRKLLRYSDTFKEVRKVYRYLVAWNDDTNPEVRIKAKEIFKVVKGSYIVENRVAVQTLHHLMRRSIFVICPRGAGGWDTHRVWEALYCGAIPVLCDSSIPKSALSWPILFVREWEELVTMPEEFYAKQVESAHNRHFIFKEFETRLWEML